MTRVRLSNNFYLDEFTRSQTAARFGIDNSIQVGSVEHDSLLSLTQRVLQPIRDALGPVIVSSGYRGSLLNLKIGGSSKSQHVNAEACDFTVLGYTPLEVCQWIINNLDGDFDQLIHEFSEWVHVSHVLNNTQRGSILTASHINGETIYRVGL